MIQEIRRNQILDILSDNEIHTITELNKAIETSESTLRRDLKDLVLSGDIELLRGGGVRAKKVSTERAIEEKFLINLPEKERIATYAANIIHDNDVIYLDPSSINYLLVDHISVSNLKVFTNSFGILSKLTGKGFSCTFIGGDVKQRTNSCIGPIAQQIMQDVRFTKSFIGANGISTTMGLTSHDSRERAIKQIAIKNSLTSYFLVDSSKHNEIATYKIADISDYTIITDHYFDDYCGIDNIIVV